MDEESQYFEEESELESQYNDGDGENTLQTGKKSSKKKKTKKQIKQEKRARDKVRGVTKGGVCGTGQDKACCIIF